MKIKNNRKKQEEENLTIDDFESCIHQIHERDDETEHRYMPLRVYEITDEKRFWIIFKKYRQKLYNMGFTAKSDLNNGYKVYLWDMNVYN